MKVKELRAQLDRLVKEHPEIDEMTVIYATDEEGNDYRTVENTPTTFEVADLTAYSLDIMVDDEEGDEENTEGCNALCIN